MLGKIGQNVRPSQVRRPDVHVGPTFSGCILSVECLLVVLCSNMQYHI